MLGDFGPMLAYVGPCWAYVGSILGQVEPKFGKLADLRFDLGCCGGGRIFDMCLSVLKLRACCSISDELHEETVEGTVIPGTCNTFAAAHLLKTSKHKTELR